MDAKTIKMKLAETLYNWLTKLLDFIDAKRGTKDETPEFDASSYIQDVLKKENELPILLLTEFDFLEEYRMFIETRMCTTAANSHQLLNAEDILDDYDTLLSTIKSLIYKYDEFKMATAGNTVIDYEKKLENPVIKPEPKSAFVDPSSITQYCLDNLKGESENEKQT